MKEYQKKFIDLAIKQEALRFGQFTLKSGRASPYFFNLGMMTNGQALSTTAECFAECLVESDIPYDGLFGPAYKGIPIVSTTAIMLFLKYQLTVPYTFNRKETKQHGEGGQLVGAPLRGKVVLLDDVITAGTAIDESYPLFQQAGAQLSGIVLALNRQEKGKTGNHSAVKEIGDRYDVPVVSIIALEHIAEYLSQQGELEKLAAIEAYQAQWGAD
ncbi:MAG: orotate phosphoribosyltransferase [Legionellales bacterium]|nr:orotate phosphoribosyltransferase [Legionellales bacterium]|tara:strand:- start:152 stop:796 length:645 start_codon:yes stop_codon:yes gene_type:complete